MKMEAVGVAKTGTEGTTETGTVGIAKIGSMGVAGAVAEGISTFATTPSPSKVFAKYGNRHTN